MDFKRLRVCACVCARVCVQAMRLYNVQNVRVHYQANMNAVLILLTTLTVCPKSQLYFFF